MVKKDCFPPKLTAQEPSQDPDLEVPVFPIFPSSTLGSDIVRQEYFLKNPSVLLQLLRERSPYAFVPLLLWKSLPWFALLLGFSLLWPAQMDTAKSSLSL